jgi:hypothetical protein
MKRSWNYASAENTRVGTMICTACRIPIENGEYRYRETEDAYLPQHRACSEQDEGWKFRDKQKAINIQKARQYLADCLNFRSKWLTDVLNDEIESTETELKKLTDIQYEIS